VRGRGRTLMMFLYVAVASMLAGACSLAPLHGYFHQVTALRGRVVGKSLGPFQFRWLRQSFAVGWARLALYEYRWPAKIENLKLIATVTTDARGDFDFGQVPKGHYVLTVKAANTDLMGFFEIEITDTVRATRSITIDVSPTHPDCTGGHEFIETKS
jgi:hypothetical protein